VNPSVGSNKISVRDYVERLGSFSGENSEIFTSGEGIRTIEMNELENLMMPKLNTLNLTKLTTINLNQDITQQSVLNADNMVMNVKDITFVNSSGNRISLSEVIRQLSNS
jgi:hypothetical protein